MKPLVAVEQLDMETKEVLNTFVNHTKAAERYYCHCKYYNI